MTNAKQWFRDFEKFIDLDAPKVIGETAFEYFRGSFRRKAFNKVPWPLAKRKKKKGSLMVTSGLLQGSIQIEYTQPRGVRIRAGGSRVPYAAVHNNGGIITRNARSETFIRNRKKRGFGKGRFARGTTPGKGMSFKSYSFRMPKRQFVGPAEEMNDLIRLRLKVLFNNR
ncbi:phage virion morphogenesis protein [Pedobacter zeae]|uniref:Phage gpG-like protein n=1 Tax=Pedobacter zeae TaxID=1737356 RepID=A0A7W6K7M8_9SPHI|nr:phage virion morphogenesis protein [Pedobacter zeae]MBB4106630.1 phage gpG-like protein [Pedobacter zeae]GGH02822.1 hypothetical protein GCM10007422_17500 [Pedobacter zeae]